MTPSRDQHVGDLLAQPHDALEAHERLLMREHLAVCEHCRRIEQYFRSLDASLRQATNALGQSEPSVAVMLQKAMQTGSASYLSSRHAKGNLMRKPITLRWLALALVVVSLGVGLGYYQFTASHTTPITTTTPNGPGPIVGAYHPSPLFGENRLSMVSATEGWILEKGQVYHYEGNTWQMVNIPHQGGFAGIAMRSATDGWLAGGYTPPDIPNASQHAEATLFHYDGSKWQAVPTTIHDLFTRVQVTSDGAVWLLCGYQQCGDGKPNFVRYYQGQWTPFSVPAQFGTFVFTSYSMLSSDEGWLISDESTNGQPTYGQILHYHAGRWDATSFKGALLSIAMRASTDGWCLGKIFDSQGKGTLFLLRYAEGQWQSVPVPNEIAGQNMSTVVANVASSSVWLYGRMLSTSQRPTINPLIVQYQHGQWTYEKTPAYTGPDDITIEALAIVNDANVWAIGDVFTRKPMSLQPLLLNKADGIWHTFQLS